MSIEGFDLHCSSISGDRIVQRNFCRPKNLSRHCDGEGDDFATYRTDFSIVLIISEYKPFDPFIFTKRKVEVQESSPVSIPQEVATTTTTTTLTPEEPVKSDTRTTQSSSTDKNEELISSSDESEQKMSTASSSDESSPLKTQYPELWQLFVEMIAKEAWLDLGRNGAITTWGNSYENDSSSNAYNQSLSDLSAYTFKHGISEEVAKQVEAAVREERNDQINSYY